MNRLAAILFGLALAACGNDPVLPPATPAPGTSSAALPATSAPGTDSTVPLATSAPKTDPAAPPETSAPETPSLRSAAPRAPRAPPATAPRLSLLVNGQGDDAKVVAGWPVVVRLDLSSSDGKPVTVSGGNEHWSARVRLETGHAEPWPLTPAAGSPEPATLGNGVSATHYWTIDAEASARLPRGEGTLRAVLECAKAEGGAWAGVATNETRLRVVDEPAPLPPEWAELESELEVDLAYCRSGAAKALAHAEAAAKAQPASWRLASLRGHLLASAGRDAEAEAAFAEATTLWWRANPKGCEPPW